ncbi:MAG: hypothetical protein QM270_00595 [Bacillota bacterium]|nr:hypothetical protein [Bacillota bacterium]
MLHLSSDPAAPGGTWTIQRHSSTTARQRRPHHAHGSVRQKYREVGEHARRAVGKGKSSLRTSDGQNEEISKKRFGLLAILTTKGLFLVKTRSNPKNDLAKSPILTTKEPFLVKTKSSPKAIWITRYPDHEGARTSLRGALLVGITLIIRLQSYRTWIASPSP